jgi:thiamine pyrophosphokinase
VRLRVYTEALSWTLLRTSLNAAMGDFDSVSVEVQSSLRFLRSKRASQRSRT